jgi:hypothetical protein
MGLRWTKYIFHSGTITGVPVLHFLDMPMAFRASEKFIFHVGIPSTWIVPYLSFCFLNVFSPSTSPSPTHLQKHTWPLAAPCAFRMRIASPTSGERWEWPSWSSLPTEPRRIDDERPMNDRALRCATRSWRHREKGGAFLWHRWWHGGWSNGPSGKL